MVTAVSESRLCPSGKAAVTRRATTPADSSTVVLSKLRLTAPAGVMKDSSSTMGTAAAVSVPSSKPPYVPLMVTERANERRVKSSTGVKSKAAVAEVRPAGMVMLRPESSTVWKCVPSVVFAPAPTAKPTVISAPSA